MLDNTGVKRGSRNQMSLMSRGRRAMRKAFAIVLVFLSVSSRAHGQVGSGNLRAEIGKRDRFRVVDILVYKNKPVLSELGMLSGWGTSAFWPPGHVTDSINEAAFRKAIRPFTNFAGLFYIDIEKWPVCNAPDSVIARSIARYNRAIDIVRAEAPNLTFGIYSTMPAPAYWPVVANDTVKLRRWHVCNQRLAVLAKKVDVIFPSLYTFYDDEAGWDKYAKGVLDEARQYNKPVYAFLWPEYHESNARLGGKPIPGHVWRHQLEFTKEHADGVVLWNGRRSEWDDHAGWWLATREFLAGLPAAH